MPQPIQPVGRVRPVPDESTGTIERAAAATRPARPDLQQFREYWERYLTEAGVFNEAWREWLDKLTS